MKKVGSEQAQALSEVEKRVAALLAAWDAGQIDQPNDIIAELTELDQKLPPKSRFRDRFTEMFEACM